VRQSGKRQKVPVLLDVVELHRLFDELELREGAMIVCDALTGMRRSELMGLQWCDLDFFDLRINIARSVVYQVIGNCKQEAPRTWRSPDPIVLPAGCSIASRWQARGAAVRTSVPASTRKLAGTLSAIRSRR
jgi:integrase